jgi:hypothetical protein
MIEQRFPKGWDEERVRRVIEHYESLTEDEEAAEIEAALDDDKFCWIAVPNELINEVRRLIAGHDGSRE